MRKLNYRYRRGEFGVAFAPRDQKQMAISIMQEAEAQKDRLLKEMERLQDKIDALPIDW